MASHSSVLAWRIPGMGEPSGLPSMGSHRVGHDWSDLAAAATGIPSLPLALLAVMLPKACLTLHSRMSGSRWVITPSWLSGSWRSILYSSLGYFCYLFLISSPSAGSIPFVSFIVPLFAWNIPLVCLVFLKRSLVFPILLFSTISLYWSLRMAFLPLLGILWKSAFKWEYISFSLLPLASSVTIAMKIKDPCFWEEKLWRI